MSQSLIGAVQGGAWIGAVNGADAAAGSVGTASGTSTASGVGSSTSTGQAAGTASGSSTATGVGASKAGSVGTASGTSTASGVAPGGSPLAAGSIALASATKSSIALTLGAASGGTGTKAYQVWMATRQGGTFSSVSGATAPGSGGVVTISTLTPARVYTFYAIVTDGASATSQTGNLDAAAWPSPRALHQIYIGDSNTANQRNSSTFAQAAGNQVGSDMRDGLSSIYSAVTAWNEGASGSQTSDWLPTAGNFAINDWDTGSPYAAPLLPLAISRGVAAAPAGAEVEVIACLGTNDAQISARSGAAFKANVQAIDAYCLAHGVARVIWNYPPYPTPTGGTYTPAKQALTLQDYPAALEEVDDGVSVFVGDRTFAAISANTPSLGDGSGIHFSNAGYTVWQSCAASGRLGVAQREAGLPQPTPATVAAAMWAYANRTLTG